jgi:hypothetical protein
VRGRELVRLDTGAPIRLRGVNRSGLEYADPGPAGRGAAAFLDSVAFDEADLRRIAAWGANVVRVPFTQEFVLGGRGAATGADYLAALDQVVTWAEACGVYTLLDLQWIDADTPHGIGQDGPSDVDWGRRLLAYLEATTVGWTAWSWCDWPPLLADHRGGDCTPTPFGELVRAGLMKAGPTNAGSGDSGRSAAEP